MYHEEFYIKHIFLFSVEKRKIFILFKLILITKKLYLHLSVELNVGVACNNR
jgi:hypothetical protein